MPAILALTVSASAAVVQTASTLAGRASRGLKRLVARIKNRHDAMRLAALDDRMPPSGPASRVGTSPRLVRNGAAPSLAEVMPVVALTALASAAPIISDLVGMPGIRNQWSAISHQKAGWAFLITDC